MFIWFLVVELGRLSKVWVQRLRINGRATNLGLGSFPVVGLATARERALDNRRKIEQGIGTPRDNSLA